MNDNMRNNLRNSSDWFNSSWNNCPGCGNNNAMPENMMPTMDRGAMRMQNNQPAMAEQAQNMMPQNEMVMPMTALPRFSAESSGYESPLGITGQGTGRITYPQGTGAELGGLTAIDVSNQPTAVNLESLRYLNGFLLTQIGKKVMVEFLIGSNIIEEKTGVLVGVGANYILISEFPSENVLACDFYSIKFITFYY